MSNTYCPLPWIGLNILPGDTISPCCQWAGMGYDLQGLKNLDQDKISEVFNNVRKDMIEGKQISECEQCYLAEKSGVTSRRQEAINQYGIINTPSIKILDISFDNVCNLKCRGCASGASHLWFDDEKILYDTTLSDKKYLSLEVDLDTLDMTNLESINVSGGEPFLSKKFESFLEKISNSNKDLSLVLSTNGTILPSPSVFKSLALIKQLNLNISIDGIGHMNEYFRSGADFKKCLENLEKFKDLKDSRKDKHTFINIHTTVSIYNVNLLGEIREFFNNRFPEYNQSHRILYWPEQLCIRNMPDDYKDLVRPLVENLGPKYIDVLNELNNKGEDHFEHFLNYHYALDEIRLESLKESNPLLSDYIKKYQPTKNSKMFFIKQLDLIR